jgi:hypothetical protein
MDNVFAIGFGLGLRYVLSAVGQNDVKLASVLIGIWEGAVTLHFVQKAPYSFDPYVALGVRMFIDFLATESVLRTVLILLWTGIGMVLADITPALWEDTGMRRFWARFERDAVVFSRSIAFPFYSKPRTVRFSPSRAATIIPSNPSSVVSSPAASRVPLGSDLAVPQPTRRISSRLVPGAFTTYTDSSQTSRTSSSSRPPSPLVLAPSLPDTTDSDDDLYGSSTTTEVPDIASVPDIPDTQPEPDVQHQIDFASDHTQTPTLDNIPIPFPDPFLHPEVTHERIPSVEEVPDIATFGDDPDGWIDVGPEDVPLPPTPPPKTPEFSPQLVKTEVVPTASSPEVPVETVNPQEEDPAPEESPDPESPPAANIGSEEPTSSSTPPQEHESQGKSSPSPQPVKQPSPGPSQTPPSPPASDDEPEIITSTSEKLSEAIAFRKEYASVKKEVDSKTGKAKTKANKQLKSLIAKAEKNGYFGDFSLFFPSLGQHVLTLFHRAE